MLYDTTSATSYMATSADDCWGTFAPKATPKVSVLWDWELCFL